MSKACQGLIDARRRMFLQGGAAAGVAALGSVGAASARSARPSAHGAVLIYPKTRVGRVAALRVNEPLAVSYPDADAPGVLLKLGQAVHGGVGPDGDIVGFSTLCPHQGFPLRYSSEDRSFDCPGHYARFDAEAAGQQIWGQATQNLPQYLLSVDARGDIYAEGLDELIYGRTANVLGG